MSLFNRFCAKARRAAERVGDAATEMVDSASRSVKIKALEIRIDEQYENLGRLVYRDLHTDESLEEEKLEVIAVLDGLYDELALLKETKTEEEAEAVAEEPAEEAEAASAEEEETTAE